MSFPPKLGTLLFETRVFVSLFLRGGGAGRVIYQGPYREHQDELDQVQTNRLQEMFSSVGVTLPLYLSLLAAGLNLQSIGHHNAVPVLGIAFTTGYPAHAKDPTRGAYRPTIAWSPTKFPRVEDPSSSPCKAINTLSTHKHAIPVDVIVLLRIAGDIDGAMPAL